MENRFINNNNNIHKDILISLLKQKTNILQKIYNQIKGGNRICFFCDVSEEDIYITNIKKIISLYDFLLNNNSSKHEIVNILRDNNYNLDISTTEFIKREMESTFINEMNKIHNKINNFLENKLVDKIDNFQNNQNLIINNQKFIMESLNQINGNNYDIQIINYLSELQLEPSNYSKMIRFYEKLVKKMNAYNLSATVLSSGEINVNDSMVHTTTSIFKAGINIIENIGGIIPFGQAITSLATAGGIHYINEKQLTDNNNYYDILNSVTHTEGISKLSSLKIMKQINTENIKKLNNKYVDYFVKKWREIQIKLIKEKKIPIYNIDKQFKNIDQFVSNITLYHNQLCENILQEFVISINNRNCIENCINSFKCMEIEDILYNNKREYKEENKIINFFVTKQFFYQWKESPNQ